MPFDYTLDFTKINFRERPDLYRVGRGEQGVLIVQPYKSEILPHWRFKNGAVARISAAKISRLFRVYLRGGDFVGADMARKFLQMGFTRARRYANHQSGKKYAGPVPDDKRGQSGSHGRRQLPRELHPSKAKIEAAKLFKAALEKAKANPSYRRLKGEFQAKFGK